MDQDDSVSRWFFNPVQRIATAVKVLGGLCALFTAIAALCVVVVVSLLPLYLVDRSEEVLGEYYCINNYSITTGFQIPLYTTTFVNVLPSTSTTFTPTATTIAAVDVDYGMFTNLPLTLSKSESIAVTETCTHTTTSIISPYYPNGTVFNSYALGDACYRTLQSCYYDSLLTACLLSNCYVSSFSSSSVTYPLTNYTLRCTAKIYYKTRCIDSAPSDRLYYSSSQQNSVCRQQRLERINSCLNSNTQFSGVPCMISVSSGTITSTTATCSRTVTESNNQLVFTSPSITPVTLTGTLSTTTTITPTFSSAAFTSSDQSEGHPYRISSIYSQSYSSSQAGALYCGSITHTQIASTITALINSQNSG